MRSGIESNPTPTLTGFIQLNPILSYVQYNPNPRKILFKRPDDQPIDGWMDGRAGKQPKASSRAAYQPT